MLSQSPGATVSAVAYIFSCFLANKFKIFATVEIELKAQTLIVLEGHQWGRY